MNYLNIQQVVASIVCFAVCLACGMAWVDQESGSNEVKVDGGVLESSHANDSGKESNQESEEANQDEASQPEKTVQKRSPFQFEIDLAQSNHDGAPLAWEFVLLPKNTDLKITQDKTRAYLGVHVRKADETLRKQLAIHGDFGLVVEHVAKDSAASTFGIAMHDVLLKLDSQLLVNQEQMQTLVDAKKPGDVVEVEFFRAGKTKTIDVKLSERTQVAIDTPMSELQKYHGDLMLQDGPHWKHGFVNGVQIHDCRACHATSNATLAQPFTFEFGDYYKPVDKKK